jgi:DNA polymerase-1
MAGMSDSAPRTFLIDGSALAYRSHFARGPGPAFAYANSLLALIERGRPDYALVAMDTPQPTFRHEAYDAYKATREKTPPELIEKLPLFERIAKCLGFPLYALPGWEADDVIGTLAARAAAAGHEVFIVTGDKDFLQVVSDKVLIWNPTGPGSEPVLLGVDAVRERFHCRPERVMDVLGLMGDSSDNIPGVPNVGEKTALKLIEQYDGLDEIYAKLDDVRPPGLQERLRKGRELAYLSRDLATIRLDAPVELALDSLRYRGPDADTARSLFVELDFPSLAEKLGQKVRDDERHYHVVRTVEEYEACLAAVRGTRELVVDLETTSLTALEAEIVGIALSVKEHEAFYLPANLDPPIFGPGDRSLTARERFGEDAPGGEMFPLHADTPQALRTTGRGLPDDPLVPPAGSDLARFLADIKPVLEDARVAVIGQNIKYDLLVFGRYGIVPANVAFDTMLASYCLAAHQNQHGLDFLTLKHLGITKIPTSQLLGKGAKQIGFWDVPVDRGGEYACEDADMTLRLQRLFAPQLLGSEVEHLFHAIEMPLVRVLESMERHGVLVDVAHLRRLAAEMGERLEALTQRIHELAGEPFNVASPKQLAEVLFEKLEIHKQVGVTRLKRTKTGFSTDAEVLETLSEHPLAAAVIEHRQLTKLKGTYVDSLPGMVHPVTGRIHTSFHQAVAATGRLSSSDPNLQNIPIRTEEGRRIREAFVAPEGCVLLAADYSQVELRLMAHLSGDAALIEAFRTGDDIHKRTAALVFGVPPDAVTSEMRGRAKTINFGILYGMGAQRLARSIQLTVKEATAFIEQYFQAFSGVRAWLDRTREEAQAQGFVSTIIGRRREFNNLEEADGRQFAGAMNAAVNTPLQGSAADLIKIAMVKMQAALADELADVAMVLQVHDELVFEVPEARVEAVTARAREIMEGALTLDVPLVVDVGTGRNWVEAH